MKHLLKSVLIIAFVSVLLLLNSQIVWANDPWYVDLSTHWSNPYVYTLWLEEVTDGLLIWLGKNYASWYLPDQPVTKGELSVFLAKVFSLQPVSPVHQSYPDVPKNYCILNNKPAWGYIEAALSGGISFTPPEQPFYPDSSITREDAVELLVRSLSLKDYADSLSEQEVMSLLRKFSDGTGTSPSRRYSMACAIKLKIIEGYDDGTLRPDSLMLRSHAATVIYRSCTIRATVSPHSFSPDGDDIDETVDFYLSYLRNRGISTWQFNIEDHQGKIVYCFNKNNAAGYPPELLTWNGKDKNGKSLPAGIYHYQAQVTDINNNNFFSVKKPVQLIYHTLSATLFPSTCTDGDILKIGVQTEPEAQQVYANFQDGTRTNLTPDSKKRNWNVNFPVNPSLPSGTQPVMLHAEFNRAERNKTLYFTRIPLDFIIPDITPNPAEQGQTIRLTCRSSQNIIEVTAYLFDSQINLNQNGNQWESDYLIPIDTPQGDYQVTFCGFTEETQLTQTITLTVTESYLANLRFVLTN